MNSARQALENVERVSDRGLVVELWCGCGHDLDWYRTSTGNARCRVESCCGATTETLRGRTVRPQLVMATKPRGGGDYTKGCVTNWLNSCGRWVRRWTWSESFSKGLQRTYDQIGSSKNKTAHLDAVVTTLEREMIWDGSTSRYGDPLQWRWCALRLRYLDTQRVRAKGEI